MAESRLIHVWGRVLAGRFRLIRRIPRSSRVAISVIAVAAVCVAIITLVLRVPHGAGAIPIAVAVAFVLLFGLVVPRPRRPKRQSEWDRPLELRSAAWLLLNEYGKLARQRGRKALMITLERSRSLPGREILAFLASNGRYSLVDISATLEDYRDPVLRPGARKVLDQFYDPWLAELARLYLIQASSPQDLVASSTIYDSIAQRRGLEWLSPEHQHLFVEALLGDHQFERAVATARSWIDPTELESRLIADSLNPYLRDRSEATDPEGWLTAVNAGFAGAGLESITLVPGDAAPLDRIECRPENQVDVGPLVTVVITSFRPDHTLFTAVRSSLASSWANLEVLVIDDASGPEFEDLYEEVAHLDARVRVERQTSNRGTYAGRNRALALAAGELVTFHDSDDWMHPRRIQIQVEHLLANPDLPANASASVRVTDQLAFSNSRSPQAKICEPSILLRRDIVVRRIGYFDVVRKNGDTEYRRRLQSAFGTDVPIVGELPLTWQRTATGSLSHGEVGREWITPARRAYMNCFAPWHAKIAAGVADPYVAAGEERVAPFYAPPELTDQAGRARSFDVLFVSNWMFNGSQGGSQRSNEEEIRALTRAGYRVAVAHLDAFWFMWPRRQRFSDRLVALLNDGVVELVQLDSPTTAELVVVRYPPVLQFATKERSSISAGTVVIVANQPPYDRDGSGRRYDIATTTDAARALFGQWPSWAPQGPLVRELLVNLVAPSRLLPFDVPAIIEPSAWSVDRPPRDGRRPVVGRYSRDIGAKWPDTREDLLAAYSSASFDTRMMGGPNALERILGDRSGWPPSWVVLAEGEIETREFLSGIDFFVYFHASSYREAFGRSIIEAMASGAVVVLPRTFQPVFGDAAVYCAPNEVEDVVVRLFGNDDAYADQQRRALAFVDSRTSYKSYVTLVEQLIARPGQTVSIA